MTQTRARWLAIPICALLVFTGTAANAVDQGSPLTEREWASAAESSAQAAREQGAKDSLYAATTIDAAHRTVIVYRKGGGRSALYDRGSALDARGAAKVEFRSAPLTSAETYQLIDTIYSRKAELAERGFDIVTVTSEWTGPVTVTVRTLNPAAASPAAEFSPGTVDVRQHQSTGAPAYLNRDFDVAPFKAGAHIIAADHSHPCSSGFTGLSSLNGARYMITARHCVNQNDPRFWTSNSSQGGGGSFIGTATALDAEHDIAYIRVGNTAPLTWDGPIFPKGSQFTKRVVGMQHPEVGMANVCTSGAYSGARCYGTIIKGGRAPFGEWLWLLRSNTGAQIAGGGDSGGPVFRPSGNTVYALGMMSQSDADPDEQLPAPVCSGTPQCYKSVWFADLYTEAFIKNGLDMTK